MFFHNRLRDSRDNIRSKARSGCLLTALCGD
jgi:hypothetical protein